MFRALLVYLQEVLYNDTWYTACVLCQLAAAGIGVDVNVAAYVTLQ
jgi:hypothetical protein